MKLILFSLITILSFDCFAYTHIPYAVVYCGDVNVQRNIDETDTMSDMQIWIWPDGCASTTSEPYTELARCYYKCHRSSNSNIDCWANSEKSGKETVMIRQGYLVKYDVYRTAEQSIIKEETSLKLTIPHKCTIDTKVPVEPVYPYEIISISGAPLPEK